MAAVETGLTYALKELNSEGSQVRGLHKIDGLEALRQAVFLLLHIEQGAWAIFSSAYGVDLGGLLGQPAAYVIPEVERRLREALLYDDRVLAAEDFQFSRQGRRLAVSLVVRSVYGDLPVSGEITL